MIISGSKCLPLKIASRFRRIRGTAYQTITPDSQHIRAISEWVNGYFHDAPEPISTWVSEARKSTRGALKRSAEAFFRRWGPDPEAALTILTSKNRLWDPFESNRVAF